MMQLRHQPAVLALSRQPLPTLDRRKYAPAAGVARGAYVLADAPGGNPEVILIASGSEVSLAVEAHEQAGRRGHPLARRLDAVVGHLRAPDAGVPRQRAAARGDGARRGRAGLDVRLGALRRAASGRVIGMKTFGASAPLKELQQKFGFEPDRVATAPRSSWASSEQRLRGRQQLAAGGDALARTASTSASSRDTPPASSCCSSIAPTTRRRRAWFASIRRPTARTTTGTSSCPACEPGQLYGYRVARPVRPAERAALRSRQGAARSLRPRRRGSARLRPRGRARARATTPRRP